MLNSLDLRSVIFGDYRDPFFIAISFAISALALRPDATLIPVILNLSVLLTYTPFLFRSDEHRQLLKTCALGLVISIGTTLFRLQASLQALSSKTQSVLVLLTLSSVLSTISIGVLWASKFSTRLTSRWSQILFFPSLWATTWWAVSYLSPVGYLSTWNVVDNTDAYNWVIQYLGPLGKNWIIGAWAVVISQTTTSWFMGHSGDYEDLEQEYDDISKPRKFLAAALFFLAIPSFFVNPLPLPIYEIDKASPVTVGCVIPPYRWYKQHHPSLDDFISESNKLRSLGARIILWPEGAVVFKSPTEKEEAFKKIRAKITGPYVGVSFEETMSDPRDSTGRTALSQTGIAVISQHFEKPHLVYYKRNLVPFAESYRLRGATTPPRIFSAEIPNPGHGITNPEWAPNGTHTRPIPVSASICLDFANPSPFADLNSRPGLILAPARTWDRTVGYAMWLQAKQRAQELNSMVLWCDGGEGGVSGIAGGVFNDISQVGAGSFVETIGVQYPFDMDRTPYARFGHLVLLLWLPLFVSMPGLGLFGRGVQRAIRNRFNFQRQTPANSAQQSLIDV